MGISTIFFTTSLAITLLVFAINCIEHKYGRSLFSRIDPFVQRIVSRLSSKILSVSNNVKRTILVGLYNMNGNAPKTFWSSVVDRKERLLKKLKGHDREFVRAESNKEVSPFLKEMSRFDNSDR